MRKNFYIFRHGETDLNKEKRCQGSGIDYDLNETGVAQASGLAEKLKGKNLEIIFSSPLLRARHTAETVAGKLGVEVKTIPDLRECFYGDAEGALLSDIAEKWPHVALNWDNPACMDLQYPNGENKKDVLVRVMNVLEELVSQPYSTMGIAIHGGTMATLLNHFKFEFDKIPNCAAFKLVYEDGKFSIDGGLF